MGRLTHTVSGSIATVRSPAVAPIESLKVHFSPIQEGTGDPSPSNVRPITGWTGVTVTKVRNIWDGRYEKGYINASGQIVSNNDTFVNVGYIDIIPNSKIKFRFTRTNISAANIHLFYYNENKEYINDRWIGPNGDINISANTRYIRFQMDTAYSATYDGKDLSVYYSDEAETIPVTFPAVGKNLYDAETYPMHEGYWLHGGNGDYSNGPAYACTFDFVPCRNFAGRTITLNTHLPSTAVNPGIAFYDENKTFISGIKNNNASGTSTIYNVPNDAYYLRFTVPAGSTNVQLELGSTATTYEPYSSDNTVYGGYVDLATGNIVATYKSIIFDGSEDEAWNNEYGDNYYIKLEDSKVNDTNYCNVAKYLPATSQLAVGGCKITGTLNFNIQIGNVIGINYDVPGFRTWLSEHNIQLVYALGNSKIVATLTPQELATFRGYTNFWSNAGDVDVTYQVVESSEMTKERQKIFAGNAPTIHTTSGSVANFEMEPGLNRNLKSCKVGFLPVQEGSGDPFPPINQNGSIVGVDNLHNESELSSFKIHFSPVRSGTGDPSPTNIRPITGWTGVTGYKGGKNLLDPSTHYTASHYESQGMAFDLNSDGSVTINGTVVEGASSSPQFVFVWNQPITGNYYFCANIPYSGTYNEIYMYDNTVGARCRQWDGVSNGLSSHSARPLCEAQLIAGHSISLVIRISRDTGFTYDNVKCSPMLMASNCTDTTFEAYSAPTSYPVSWESQGTVYGGYVDLVSGDVVATMLYKKHRVGDSHVDATYESTKRIDVLLDSDCLSKANGTTSNTISSYFTYAYNNLDNPHFYLTDPNRIRCFVPIDIDDNTEIEFACTLLNPTVVTTLTPTQIALATGKSSYWSNAYAVTVETVGNIRPINGFGKINTTRCSKNLYHYDENNVRVESLNSGLIRAVYHTGIYGDGRNFVLSAHRKDPNVGSTANINLGYCKNGINYVPDYFITTSEERTPTCKRLTGEEITLVLVSASDAALKSNLQRFDIQIEFGTTPSVYEPYFGNTFPIAFPAQDKNLFDGQYVKGIITGNPTIGYTWNNVNTNANSAIIKCSPNTTYTIKKHSSSNRFSVATCSHYPATNDSLNLIVENSNISQYTCTTGNDAGYLIVYVSTGTEQAEPDLMVEVGSSASAYEPYDNTILGGYVDLVSGEVWKKYGIWDCGDIGWSTTVSNNRKIRYASVNNMVDEAYNISHLYCSSYKFENCTVSDLSGYSSRVSSIIKYSYNGPRVAIRDDTKESLNDSDFKNAVKDIKIIAELATPVLVTTLTPTQIQALKGTNNILSDANGIIEVKYWSH